MFFDSEAKQRNPSKIIAIQGIPKAAEAEASSDDVDVGLLGSKEEIIDDKEKKKRPERFPTWYALVILSFCFGVFFIIVYTDHRLPKALTKQDIESNPGRFIEERARTFLKKLTSMGPRPAGSYENEVLAVDLLKQELKSIQSRAKPVHKMTIDIQKPRGSFNLKFIDGLTHHYRNIQNVIVKLESAEIPAKDALLINCHFDSVPSSPGASDDAVSCAIMIEMLNILVQREQPLKNSLILLFNGAEENMLPGSHGFITQHEWASQIRAFINLEACGAGGRELVFQSGPDHPWMIEAYGEAAPYPFASVIGQEIFQSGVIPGDTDFRIFRDYGNIPGLDIAYMKNGFVYHTKYDSEDMIPAGSIQRAGDNVLAVVQYIGDMDIIERIEHSSRGNVVFFDFLGLFLVHYPEWLGMLVNILVVSGSVSITVSKVRNAQNFGVSRNTFIKQLGLSFGYQIAALVFSLIVVVIIATFLDAVGRSMSWYARPYLIFFLYVCPTLFTITAVLQFALTRQKRDFNYMHGKWAIESLYFEVNRIVWTFFTFVLTALRIQSSFFCMCWVLFPSLGRLLIDRLFEREPWKKVTKGWRWLAIHLTAMFLPLIFSMAMIYNTFVMFIPIMGRAGSALNPDLLIGCKTVFMILATVSFLAPITLVIYRPNRIVVTLYMTTLLSVILVVTTRLGFPYSGSRDSLAPHRSLIFHTHREFYNQGKELIHEDSGYFLINLDRNSPKVLTKDVPQIYGAEEISDEQCEELIYCGVPMYYPCSTMLRINNWIRTTKPRFYRNTSVELLARERSGLTSYRLLFRANGPDHMGIYFAPKENIYLKNWSFVEGDILSGPIWKNNRTTHFIYYSHGLSPTAWEFWLEFQVPKTFLEHEPIVDLSVAGHFVHGNEMKSPDFKIFLSKFPSWSFPVGWTVAYRTYVF